jgi:hypothetical protein
VYPDCFAQEALYALSSVPALPLKVSDAKLI